MKFPSKKWNDVVLPLSRENLSAGKNARLSWTKDGVIVSAGSDTGKWSHPWKVSVFWTGKKKKWRASVKAGFVNGLDPLVGEVPLLDMELEKEEGIALPFGKWDGPVPKFF